MRLTSSSIGRFLSDLIQTEGEGGTFYQIQANTSRSANEGWCLNLDFSVFSMAPWLEESHVSTGEDRGSANGAKYNSQGQAPSNARRVAPGYVPPKQGRGP